MRDYSSSLLSLTLIVPKVFKQRLFLVLRMGDCLHPSYELDLIQRLRNIHLAFILTLRDWNRFILLSYAVFNTSPLNSMMNSIEFMVSHVLFSEVQIAVCTTIANRLEWLRSLSFSHRSILVEAATLVKRLFQENLPLRNECALQETLFVWIWKEHVCKHKTLPCLFLEQNLRGVELSINVCSKNLLSGTRSCRETVNVWLSIFPTHLL